MGEDSKRSGEIGEKISSELLKKMGWKTSMYNISIDCNNKVHLNEKNKPRSTHGIDQIFLYNSPFHDDRTDFVYISDKNNLNKYPKVSTLRAKFKLHLKEIHQTIDCAKYSNKINSIGSSFGAKIHQRHSGLLIWLQDDISDIERDIKPELASAQLENEDSDPVYVVDNARASFLLKVVDNLNRRSQGGDYHFYYPRIGTAISVDIERKGRLLPLELIASDVITAVVQKEGKQEFVLYANEAYDADAYKKLVAYGFNFATGLVSSIAIGMPDYNPTRDENETREVRMSFQDRTEEVTPFSFNRSFLDLLED